MTRCTETYQLMTEDLGIKLIKQKKQSERSRSVITCLKVFLSAFSVFAKLSALFLSL
jgi:hypothetical protein